MVTGATRALPASQPLFRGHWWAAYPGRVIAVDADETPISAVVEGTPLALYETRDGVQHWTLQTADG